MTRKPRFLIAIASAIITFSILFAVVGKPKYFSRQDFKTTCHKVAEPNNKNK